MEARDAEVANLIAIDAPCSGCVLAEGHSVSPDFIDPNLSTADSEDIRTTLTVSSYNGRLRTTEFDLQGVIRKDQIINHLNTPVEGESIACNALCSMILKRRGSN